MNTSLTAVASVIVTVPNNVSESQVDESCDAFVNASGVAYGAGRTFAANLLGFLGTEWIDMAHDAKGEAGDKMRAQRDKMYAKLRALPIPHSNPSVKWKQIKDHARSILAEQEKAEREAAGEPEPEASEGSGKAKHTRSPQLRYVEDLTGLYKMGKREAKTLTAAQQKVHTLVTAALSELGVDISQL